MKIKLDRGAFMPVRAHDTDAGMDIKAIGEHVIPAHGSQVIKTGVHEQLPHGYAGLFVSKSGLNVKQNICSTGLIDEGYTGELIVKLYNHGSSAYTVHEGDKITQLVVIPVAYEPIEVVDSLDDSERGSDGFGSTGKQ